MAIELTNRTLRALEELSIEPNLIVRVDGFNTLFSAVPVREFLTYGYPDVFYGDPGIFYGGLVDVKDNKTYIDSQNTNYSIKQQMSYDDESGGNSISTMVIGLVDKNEEITQLISPGFDLEDILGRKIEVFQQFGDTDFFSDAIIVFKGVVTKIDSMPGIIKLKINHPDNKKKVKLFKSVETQNTNLINSSQTTIEVTDASTFILPQGPLSSYIRIGTELIQYTSIVGNVFGGVTRGALSSTAAPHDPGDQVKAMYCLEGNPLDLALNLMMSGFGTDPIHSGIQVASFVKVGAGSNIINNAIYFESINLVQTYGLTAGDTVTITGATNAANNFVQRTITDVVKFESGFYLVVDGAALIYELDSAALMDTFSQYNTLPDGLRMKPEEVDIEEHNKLKSFFFSSTQYRLYIKTDDIDGKAFLDEQIYRPIACYALPRKTQASVGYTVGPIPGENIKTLNIANVKNGKNIVITRTTNRSFYNEVVYRYDDTPLSDSEKFLNGNILINQTSKNRIPGSTKTYVVSSLGLKTDLNALNIIQQNGQRVIDRYKYAAEMIQCKVLLRDSVGIEIGDIVVTEFDGLKVSDITKGSRDFKNRLFEVQNKSLDLKTGNTSFVLLDTGVNIDQRFGLMSPVSLIAGVVSASVFVIGPDSFYPSKFGNDEYRKWENIVSLTQPISIRVHNADYSVDDDLVVTDINLNQFTLRDPATITLSPGLTIEFTGYVDADTSDKQKLIYAYMTDDPAFPDAGFIYAMI